jgi:SHS2 domain-containing protein
MHEWRDHTAEIELAIEAAAPEDVFAEAAAALGELIGLGEEGPPAQHELALEAADLPALLVAWIDELIFLADTESFVSSGSTDVRLNGSSIRGTVVGTRAPLEPLVKAATFHGIHFAREDSTWQARVVLDV